jgi:hypothetical protein
VCQTFSGISHVGIGAAAWGERGAGDREVTGSNHVPTLPGVVVRAVCAILVDGGWVWLALFAEYHTVG